MSKNMMTRNMLKILAVLILGFGIGCSVDKQYDLIDNFPVPEKAFDAKKLNLGTKDNQQLFFRFKDPYPSDYILNFYADFLHRNHWVRCEGKIEDWQFYKDQSSKGYPYTHEIVNYWINRDEQKFAMLMIRYYSEKLTGEKKPDNDVQNVALLVQKGINLDDEISRLSVNCS